MTIRDRIKPLLGLLVDPHNQVPPYVQLKHQIKFASTYQAIGPGDVLPSIRVLAKRLGVGTGVVRRAYRELCETGFLVTERRKHVVVAPGSIAAPELESLRMECTDRCEQLIAWAREKRISSIAIGHLLLRRALAVEADSPSYLFVDICRLAAEESAAKVAKAWNIRVAGLAVQDFAGLSSDDARRASTVLVNQCLYEDVIAGTGETIRSVFPVRMRVGDRLQRRIRRLPPKARVLLVMPDDPFPLMGSAVVHHYESLFGRKWRFHAKPIGSISDLTVLARSQRYALFLLSPVVWEETPPRLKRSSLVDRVVDEPDPRSLEETRLVAGVLM